MEMTLFLLCALVARASDSNFFGGSDHREYCCMCGEEYPTNQMTHCFHCEKNIHYIYCKDCASDEEVQRMFEETFRGEMVINGGLLITCPLCCERGNYNDDVLKEGNEDVNIKMYQNLDYVPIQINQQENDNAQEYQDYDRALEQSRLEYEENQRMRCAEANEWDEQLKQVLEESRLLYESIQRQQYEQFKRPEKYDIRGRIDSPENFQGEQNKLNSLNASLLVKKNVIKKRDRSTAHVMMTSGYMAVLFSIWIGLVPGGHIAHTEDKMGYLLQQFSRTYLGFIGLSGLLYTIIFKDAWNYKHTIAAIYSTNRRERDSDANISLFMHLASFVATILVAAGIFALVLKISSASAIVQAISWIDMFFGIFHFFGLFLQKCSKCSERRSCVTVLNDKFFKTMERQPQEWIRQKCGMIRARWRTKPVVGIWGNLTGFFSSFIPVFGLLQAVFFFVHKSELTGEQFANNKGFADVGLVLGILFTFFFQRVRWNADIGVLTGEQVLNGLIAWFMAYHSDPQTSILAIVFQIIFLGVYGVYKLKCCCNYPIAD